MAERIINIHHRYVVYRRAMLEGHPWRPFKSSRYAWRARRIARDWAQYGLFEYRVGDTRGSDS